MYAPSRRLMLAAAFVVLWMSSSVVWLGVTAPVALAGCPGNPGVHDWVGVDDVEGAQTEIHGTWTYVWVNDFDDHQYHAWRDASDIFRNSNYHVEIGWRTKEDVDQKAHPYANWQQDGIESKTHLDNVDLTPRDDFHTFKVADTDHNQHWTLNYDGNTLGPNPYVDIGGSQAIPESLAERHCTSDSLWDHVKNLRFLNGGGNWNDWSAYGGLVSGSNYNLCGVNSTEFYVKLSC